tara:strand:+ start:521 stop:706 length:186 start_codon:yes stop_codon:yes gene_type:complete
LNNQKQTGGNKMTEENQKENNCTWPPCPECGEGYMVPFSFKDDVYEKWKCTKCKYLLKKNE